MKKIMTIFAAILMTVNLYAQAPNKMSYQAVIRNNSNALVVSQLVGMRISILQTSPNGPAVYVETQSPTTNANGLVSIEIGGGTIVSGNFSSIDWSNGPYFIQTESDPTGGTSYTITGTSQLLSVPYALHANTADSITGSITENDPVFGASVASSITSADTTYWNNKQNTLNAGSNITITGNTISATTGIITENDPVFGASVASSITSADTTYWNNKQNPLNAGSNITITGNTISATGNGIFTHYIGEVFGGGVIFHLWKDNMGVEHGLIVDITDLSTSQAWSNIDQTIIGPSAQSKWDGLSNSNAIIGQTGHSNSAALLCLNSTSGGQSDWYLPSIYDFNMLWNNSLTVARSFTQIPGATVLQPASYWSSTESDFMLAWTFNFSNGNAYNDVKYSTFYVRAVRAF